MLAFNLTDKITLFIPYTERNLITSASTDFLIVGQGLAGSLLAWELLQRGANVVIVDRGGNNASQVAAGLINPVTGQRFVKSWNIDFMLPLARQFYEQISDCFQQRLYIEKPMLRLFRNESDQRQCLKRLNNPAYSAYLGDDYSQDWQFGPVRTPFGCLEQKQTGYLLTKSLLATLKNYFIARGCYRHADLDYKEIQLQPRLRWREFYPKQVIFCEGVQSIYNPWFASLPMKPAKGEILTLEHTLPLPSKIINFGYWSIPLDSHQIRIGATFDRTDMTNRITEAGRSELFSAGKQVIPQIDQAKLIDHQAGIRPCTSDRHPFIGVHPQYRQLAIFNGFGSKGSLLVPGYCRQFADFLFHQTPLPEHCNIQRFYETHFTAQHCP